MANATGRYGKAPVPAPDRFWPKVDKTDGCWLWTGALCPAGYGRFNGGPVAASIAHRFAYEQCVGPIPSGLELDHLCRVRNCVRPDHLEAVTRAENNRRRQLPLGTAHFYGAKTECPQGHPYDQANTRIDPAGSRRCRTCHREAENARRGGR